MTKSHRSLISASCVFALVVFGVVKVDAQGTGMPLIATLHSALFLVGDSIMKTGADNGERGPWGWGSEIGAFFDPAKIHVYNEGRGGRSSRGYIEEGAWQEVMAQLWKGDFVIIQFGHDDAANSQNYPDRVSLKGNGDETQEIESPVTHQRRPEAQPSSSVHLYLAIPGARAGSSVALMGMRNGRLLQPNRAALSSSISTQSRRTVTTVLARNDRGHTLVTSNTPRNMALE